MKVFQKRVGNWLDTTFPESTRDNQLERALRFLEEALELAQAQELSREQAHLLVDYVYGRTVGEPTQEVGGVMVTLAALCHKASIDLEKSADTELNRISMPAVAMKIAAKQYDKDDAGVTAKTIKVA